MKQKVLYLAIIGISIVGIGFLISPLLTGEAQKNQEQAEKQQALVNNLRQNVTASIFYDILQAKESDWNLIRAEFLGIGDDISSILLDFNKNKENLQVYIYEHETIEQARFHLKSPINQGRIENLKDFGDEGRKIISHNGFSSLAFRKGKFYVSIISKKDEETAKRFAGYIAEAITQ